jgi:hypothetical protein
VESQSLEHPLSLPKALRLTWGKQIVLALWHFHQQMWNHRNEILHKNTEVSIQIRTSPLDATITEMYTRSHEFAAIDRAMFDTPLELRLQHSIQSKKSWLTLIQRYSETTKKRKVGDQLLVTRYISKKTACPTS